MSARRPLVYNAFDAEARTRSHNPFTHDSDPAWWRNTFRIAVIILLLALLGLCIASVVGIFKTDGQESLPCEVIYTDYLVVGAGSAGIVAAKVLSDEGLKTLLMDGGTNDPDDDHLSTPHENAELVHAFTNLYLWGLGHALEMPGHDGGHGFRYPIVASRKTGGGSRVNGMQYVRGVNATYEEIEALMGGDASWGPSAWLEAYKWLEHMLDDTVITNTDVHGYEGATQVRLGATNVATATAFVNAANSAFGGTDCPIVADHNDPDTPVGASVYWQLSQTEDKLRASTSQAYLDPILDCQREGGCENPRVVLKTTAHHVIWDGTRAVGVEASRNGRPLRVMAAKAVILSMGVQSPLMLQRSGVGPADLLAEVNVPLKYANPNVGTHVRNHPLLILTATGTVNATFDDEEGLYTGAVFKRDDSLTSTTRALELLGIASPGAFTIVGLLLNATSEGNWTIVNSDPLTMPRVWHNYFSDQADVDTGVALVHDVLDIFDEMGLTPLDTFADDDEIEDYVRDKYQQSYHWISGARMGASVEAGGVVDTNCAVFGVENLYVVDNSIMPVQATGNTDAPARALGKMCADKIIAQL